MKREKSAPIPVSDLLIHSMRHVPGQADPLLAGVILKIKTLAKLEQRLKSFLPGFLTARCRLADFDETQGKLILAVDSNTMAAKWRYLKEDLLKKCQQDFLFRDLVSIEIKVNPTLFQTAENLKNKNKAKKKYLYQDAQGRRCLSPPVENLLKEMRQSVKDSKVQIALKKLLKIT